MQLANILFVLRMKSLTLLMFCPILTICCTLVSKSIFSKHFSPRLTGLMKSRVLASLHHVLTYFTILPLSLFNAYFLVIITSPKAQQSLHTHKQNIDPLEWIMRESHTE
jgi:hypothetical protein